MNNFVIIGCGDIGRRVARLAQEKASVCGVVRSEESAEKLRELGGSPVIANLDDPTRCRTFRPKGPHSFILPPRRGEEQSTRGCGTSAQHPCGEEPARWST